MTVPTTAAFSGPYYPNGVTYDYPFAFKANAESEVALIFLEDDGSETIISPSSYTVVLSSNENQPGGTVTTSSPLPDSAGKPLYVVLDADFTQGTKFEDEGAFNQSILNPTFDAGALRSIWLRARIQRAMLAPFGETGITFPRAAARANRFLSFDANGDVLLSNGTGADAGLRADLSEYGGGILAAPDGAAGDLEAWILAYSRSNTLRASLALAADVAVTAGRGFVGKGLSVSASAPFAFSTIWTLGAESELSGVVANGANMDGPVASWGAGRQKGGAGFATGADPGNRISHITFGGRFEAFKNGAFNFEYTDHVRSPGSTFIGNQTAYPGFVTCADVTGYYGRYWDLGVMINIGYGLKAHNISYNEKSHFAGFITVGGTAGFAANQWTAGEMLHVGFAIHDGVAGGYGEKVVGARQFHHGPMIAKNAAEAVQCYGGHARYDRIDSELPVGASVMCDAYQSRDQVNNSEVDFAVREIRSNGRAYAGGTAQNGLTIRGDNTRLSRFTGDGVTTVYAVGTSPSGFAWAVVNPLNLAAYANGVLLVGGAIGNGIQAVAGNNVTLAAAPANGASVVIADTSMLAPIRNIDVDLLEVSNGYSGIYEVRTPMSAIDRVRIGHVRARNLAAGGYMGFFKARDVDIMGGDYDETVRQGWIVYTDAMNRGGTIRIKNQKLKASASWTNEPFIRLGYTGTGDFAECGFEAIEISSLILNGSNDATFKAISIHGHRANTIRHIVLQDIRGINCAAAEQIYIDLSGHLANTIILDILDVHIFSAAGVPATININDPAGAIFGGTIRTSCTFTGTGRPAACWPKVYPVTQNLAALAAGATSAGLVSAVAGLAAGDRFEVVPDNVRVSVPDQWVDGAGSAGFIVTNRTAGVLGAAEPFKIYHYRRQMG